jgi:hypothetical protein
VCGRGKRKEEMKRGMKREMSNMYNMEGMEEKEETMKKVAYIIIIVKNEGICVDS